MRINYNKIFLTFILCIAFSINVFAADYCAQTVSCKNNQCETKEGLSKFDSLEYFEGSSLKDTKKDGKYFYTGAAIVDGNIGPLKCIYDLDNKHSPYIARILLQFNQNYKPEYPNKWYDAINPRVCKSKNRLECGVIK